MKLETIVTITVTIGLALVGYLATYLNNLRLARRADQLDRIEHQLKDLYGPLFALSHASNAAWRAFRKQYRPGGAFWTEVNPPSEEERAAWRLWTTNVFMPLNRRMAEAVLGHADLLVEEKMPPCLLSLLAHVSAYEAVLARWNEGDFDEHLSVNEFPRDVETYSQGHYLVLKHRQRELRQGAAQRADQV